jgi:hypothetical protein
VEETARALSAPELTAEVAADADAGRDAPGLGTSPDPGQLTVARYRSDAG